MPRKISTRCYNHDCDNEWDYIEGLTDLMFQYYCSKECAIEHLELEEEATKEEIKTKIEKTSLKDSQIYEI